MTETRNITSEGPGGNLPPNSFVSKTQNRQERRPEEQIVTGEVIVRPKRGVSWGKALLAENTTGIGQIIFEDVILTGVKTILVDTVSTFADTISLAVRKAILGSTAVPSNQYRRPVAYYAYSGTSRSRAEVIGERVLSRQARARHDFTEVILADRGSAEDVIDRLREIVDYYGAARVADLYDLVGVSDDYTDNGYGWTDLRSARARAVRGGYLLDLPRPEPLDRNTR